MNWKVLRGTAYLGSLAAVVAGGALAALNLGTFDPVTGIFYPNPVNLYTSIGALIGGGVVSSVTALLANVLRWKV